ncbi:MAG: VWA domain-containing protein [Eubacteriaceae bacterium]|nr:VWA domain-containing protein [Eubacteriaceae bacterium]
MGNNITELVFILDRSGSMSGLESDTIGGFNAMIEKQKAEEGTALVTTVLFDNEYELLHDRIGLERISPMSSKEYWVRGSTALIDAIGRSVEHISNIHKYIRQEDVPEKTVFVITTDGMENASHSYSASQVRSMIEDKKKEGWEFLFLGANIDAVQTAKHFGISEANAVNYMPDGQGTMNLYASVSKAVSSVRTGRKLDASWRENTDRDYMKRHKGK